MAAATQQVAQPGFNEAPALRGGKYALWMARGFDVLLLQ